MITYAGEMITILFLVGYLIGIVGGTYLFWVYKPSASSQAVDDKYNKRYCQHCGKLK